LHSQNFKLKVVRYNNLPFAVVFPSHLAKMPLPSTSLKRKFATRKQPVPPVVNRSGRHGGSNNNSKSSDNAQAQTAAPASETAGGVGTGIESGAFPATATPTSSSVNPASGNPDSPITKPNRDSDTKPTYDYGASELAKGVKRVKLDTSVPSLADKQIPSPPVGDNDPSSPCFQTEQAAVAISPDQAGAMSSPPPDAPLTVSTWSGSIEQGQMQLRRLYVGYKNRNNTQKPLKQSELQQRKRDVTLFLNYLLYVIDPAPYLKSKYSLDQLLKYLQADLIKADMPEITELATAALRRLEDENWGADSTATNEIGLDEEEVTVDAPSTSGPSPGMTRNNAARSSGSTSTSTATTAVRLPPSNDPIWGEDGMMRGIVLTEGARRNYVLDPRPEFLSRKRNARVIGHNGLVPGDWWPLQKVAFYHGAHGAPVRGITGSATEGAYSIVTSGSSATYDKLDEDHGDTLLYSADNSHSNTDRTRLAPITNATHSLHKSLENGQPVRVLRSSGGRHRAYTPTFGIRYDGLYRVVKVRNKQNDHKGLYEQFELRRLPGQGALADIATIPTADQIRAYHKMKEGY